MTDKNEYTLEKLGIRKDLDTLIASVDKMNSINEIRLQLLEKKTESLDVTVNGSIEGPGLSEKVRSIEGVFKHVYLIWIAVIGGLVDFIFRHIGGGK